MMQLNNCGEPYLEEEEEMGDELDQIRIHSEIFLFMLT